MAVRASLTDDWRSPLDAPGLRLYERVTHIRDSIGRVQKKRVPPALKQLHQLLTKGLQATAALWPPLQRASSLVRQAAQATVPCDWGIDMSPGPATLPSGLTRYYRCRL